MKYYWFWIDGEESKQYATLEDAQQAAGRLVEMFGAEIYAILDEEGNEYDIF